MTENKFSKEAYWKKKPQTTGDTSPHLVYRFIRIRDPTCRSA